ncbi:MAG: hypothetical protein LZ168_06825 [Thaumarchaeota archaeon]|nr:hypothetical protein [Candidatus Geocrenenecus arthurdayi]
MREKIIKFIKDVLESRGTTQEIRTVEFDLDEILEYLKESGVSNWGISGSSWKTLEEMEEYYGLEEKGYR